MIGATDPSVIATFVTADPGLDVAMVRRKVAALAAKCKGQIQLTLLQVGDSVSSKPGDAARLQKAQTDLASARQLALQFGQAGHAKDYAPLPLAELANLYRSRDREGALV